MKPTEKLYEMGQSLWLDNITRGLLTSGTLANYVRDFSITGLTSNPTIFDHAIKNTHDYDDAIRAKLNEGKSGEGLFFELALEDLTEAADLFWPAHDLSSGVDGWASLEVPPVLADDTAGTIDAAKALFASAERPNIFIKIPGTKAGIRAIEESIFAGVPINVTLLFSSEQYTAAAEAYLRGIERRLAAGLRSDIPSVASLFVSRWDVAVAGRVPEGLSNRLGYRGSPEDLQNILSATRFAAMAAYLQYRRPSARPLWASTSTKDAKASDILWHVEALAAPLYDQHTHGDHAQSVCRSREDRTNDASRQRRSRSRTRGIC